MQLLVLKKVVNFQENSPHSPKVFDRFGQNERVEQFLVSSMKICSINPSVKMFDIIMRDHIRFAKPKLFSLNL